MKTQKQNVTFVRQEIPVQPSFPDAVFLSAVAIFSLCIGAYGAYKFSQSRHELTTKQLYEFAKQVENARAVENTRRLPVWMRLVTDGSTNYYNLSGQFDGKLNIELLAAAKITTFFGDTPSDLTNSTWYADYTMMRNAGYELSDSDIWFKR